MNRRQWLYGAGMIAGAGHLVSALLLLRQRRTPTSPKPLDLTQYEPKSMLQVHESHVEKSKFPLIDFHTHISMSLKSEHGVELAPEGNTWARPESYWR